MLIQLKTVDFKGKLVNAVKIYYSKIKYNNVFQFSKLKIMNVVTLYGDTNIVQ